MPVPIALRTRIVKAGVSLATVLTVGLGVAAAVPSYAADRAPAKEYVNSGVHRIPGGMQGDWFLDRSLPSQRIGMTEALAKTKLEYTPLLRRDGDAVVDPESVTTDVSQMASGKVLTALNLRYSDRLVLHITPIDQPLDLDELVNQPFTANTRGETHFNYRFTVRGLAGVARDAGTQKWDSAGDGKNEVINSYPASIEWAETDASGQLIDYCLVGDLPVSSLAAIARQFK